MKMPKLLVVIVRPCLKPVRRKSFVLLYEVDEVLFPLKKLWPERFQEEVRANAKGKLKPRTNEKKTTFIHESSLSKLAVACLSY